MIPPQKITSCAHIAKLLGAPTKARRVNEGMRHPLLSKSILVLMCSCSRQVPRTDIFSLAMASRDFDFWNHCQS